MPRCAGAIASVILVVVPACGGSVGRFVSVNAPTVALSHVRVIDGSGGPGKDDQTLIIHDGRIQAVGDAARVTVPPSTRVFDLRGRTVFPGLIGMHEHLFYEYQPPGSAQRAAQAQDAFAWSSQDSVETLSERFVSRFELLRADAAEMTVAAR